MAAPTSGDPPTIGSIPRLCLTASWKTNHGGQFVLFKVFVCDNETLAKRTSESGASYVLYDKSFPDDATQYDRAETGRRESAAGSGRRAGGGEAE